MRQHKSCTNLPTPYKMGPWSHFWRTFSRMQGPMNSWSMMVNDNCKPISGFAKKLTQQKSDRIGVEWAIPKANFGLESGVTSTVISLAFNAFYCLHSHSCSICHAWASNMSLFRTYSFVFDLDPSITSRVDAFVRGRLRLVSDKMSARSLISCIHKVSASSMTVRFRSHSGTCTACRAASTSKLD